MFKWRCWRAPWLGFSMAPEPWHRPRGSRMQLRVKYPPHISGRTTVVSSQEGSHCWPYQAFIVGLNSAHMSWATKNHLSSPQVSDSTQVEETLAHSLLSSTPRPATSVLLLEEGKHTPQHVWKSENTIVQFFLPPLRGSQGLNSGCQPCVASTFTH